MPWQRTLICTPVQCRQHDRSWTSLCKILGRTHGGTKVDLLPAKPTSGRRCSTILYQRASSEQRWRRKLWNKIVNLFQFSKVPFKKTASDPPIFALRVRMAQILPQIRAMILIYTWSYPWFKIKLLNESKLEDISKAEANPTLKISRDSSPRLFTPLLNTTYRDTTQDNSHFPKRVSARSRGSNK